MTNKNFGRGGGGGDVLKHLVLQSELSLCHLYCKDFLNSSYKRQDSLDGGSAIARLLLHKIKEVAGCRLRQHNEKLKNLQVFMGYY